jgi:hypothetical protein
MSAQFDLPAAPDRVAALFAYKDFELAAAASDHALACEAAVAGTSDGPFTVTVRRTMSTAALPPAARGFLPAGLEIRQAVAWEAPGPDGSRDGTVAGEVPGAPVQLTGTVRLFATGEGSGLDFKGEVKAMVPLVGRTIEEAAAPAVIAALKAQHAEALRRIEADR